MEDQLLEISYYKILYIIHNLRVQSYKRDAFAPAAAMPIISPFIVSVKINSPPTL